MRFCICTEEIMMFSVSQPLSFVPVLSLDSKPSWQWLSLTKCECYPCYMGTWSSAQTLDDKAKKGSSSDHSCLYIWFESQRHWQTAGVQALNTGLDLPFYTAQQDSSSWRVIKQSLKGGGVPFINSAMDNCKNKDKSNCYSMEENKRL